MSFCRDVGWDQTVWVRMEETGWQQEGGRKTVVGGVTGLRNRRESTLGVLLWQ